MTSPATAPEEAQLFSKSLSRKLLVVGALSVLAYGVLLFLGDARAILDTLGRVSPRVVVEAVLLALVSFWIRGIRWQYYLKGVGVRVPLFDNAVVFLAGFAMSITPAKMGEVLKSLMLKERYDVPVATSAPIVLAERVTDLVGLLMLGAFGLSMTPGMALAAAITFLGAFVLVLLFASEVVGRLSIAVVLRMLPAGRVRAKVESAYEMLAKILRPKPFLVGLGLSIGSWGLHCVCISVLSSGMGGVEVPIHHALVAYSAPLLAGTVALIPGGLGVTEASMAGVLRLLSNDAMTLAEASALTILVRLVTFWFAIVLGFGALIVWHSRSTARGSS